MLVEIKALASHPWASEVVALRACLLAAFAVTPPAPRPKDD